MRRHKRFMAILLCAAMTFSVLPSAAAKAEDEEKVLEVVAEYDMSHGDGKLRDISGNENDAELVGFEDSDFVEEDGDTVLCFSGNKEKYVKLPAELVEGENFTIEAQFQTEITKQNYNQWLFCLGSKVDTWPNVKNYIFFCPVQGGNNNGKDKNMRAGIKNATSEILLGQDAQIQEGYNTVKYVFEEGKVTLSVNEEEVESIETGYSIQQILNDGTDGNVSGYIGKSLYSPEPAFRGKLKSFKICAEKKDNSDEGKVAEAKEQLQLPYENVYGNITLPKKTENGAVVTWETDHPEIVDIESHKNEGYDETPAGTVTRPQKDTTVTMTATLTYGNASDTKEFKFTVKKAAKKLKEEDYKGYFFSYFAGEGYADGEQIYFAASKNGLKWYDLNDNEPVLTSDQGEKGVRDPFILRSAEGDKFYMIATDLKINGGNGWGAAQTSGSQSLMVWESTDLVNWSDMRMVEVSGSINAGCTWAPEATYDPITGEYIVYWASKVSEDNYGKQRVYYAKTRDFYTFTEPKVYIEDKTESCIDTTIIYNKEEQMYYRYTKNEGSATNSIGAKTKTIFAEKSKTLLGEWTHIPSESLNNNQWVEGPTIFQFNQQDSSNGKWCLLVDDFGGRGYYPLVTDSLSTGEFSSPEIYTMPSRARHGTPIRVTEEEYNAVMQKWGNGSAQENDEEEQKAPVLSYDFENTEGSVITDISGNGNNGTMYGEAKVQKDEERNSNVLYLNGTSETFAELPQGFFDGRNTFSISMDMKAEKVDGNFFAFSIGQDSKKYLFMKPTQDAIKSVITTGSWGSENGFTEKTGTSVKDTWLHLTLIVDGIDMKLYLDDQLIGHNKNVKREIVEIGKELKSYLGRSFYNGDTYFKGAFDNIKVYNRVLSDSELKGEKPDPEHKVLAEFNFDEEGSGFESKYARATGTAYELADSYSEESGKALYLNGKEDNFLTVTDKEGKSLLTDATELTVSYDAKTDRSDTNWIMYAAPNKNTPQYQYEKYIGIMEKSGTTTVERYKNSGDRPANPSAQTGNDWNHIDVVMSKTDTTIYVNGQKVSSETSAYSLRSILGKNSILQVGKSNWGEGEYFKGWIDNFRIENRALTEEEVKELSEEFLAAQPIIKAVTIGSVPEREEALEYRGTDDHTAVFTKIDTKNKVMTPYIKDEADLTKVPVTFTFNGKVEIKVQDKTISNGTELDLSKDLKITLISNEKEEEWTIQKPILSNNPVLPGQYADPDIDYFDGKFWIFPTTDGYPGWSGTKFHAFSSKDLVNWTDEGIIMELANENPGKNENGVEIATSPWAEGGSAWAPTIEEKNGKYYFYYCGKFSNGQSAIGVAVADHPAGPYKDKGEALITVDMCKQAGIKMGQAIDPSIFTDDDGTSYITFGNGAAAIVQLSDDMMSIEKDTLKQINGLTDFRESVVVTKANGKYHWTWSCDDANSPNYHVNYGVSDTLVTDDGSASVTLVKKNLLAKDESLGILGSAHQSIVHVKDGKGQDRYFMAYHRFYTPLNIFTAGDGLGVHRETCIDEITFDKDGYMQVTPTHEGVDAVKMIPDEPEVPDTPDTPEQPENPEEPMNPEQPDTPQNDNGQMTTSKPAPTGDGTNVILLIMTMMIALGVVWRKKETKTK